MTIDIDEALVSADWIKSGKPLDTVAAIKERAAQEKKDQVDALIARVNAKKAAKNAPKTDDPR